MTIYDFVFGNIYVWKVRAGRTIDNNSDDFTGRHGWAKRLQCSDYGIRGSPPPYAWEDLIKGDGLRTAAPQAAC
jgi:hypothetical protein